MESILLSDLEEGEILEQDYIIQKNTKIDYQSLDAKETVGFSDNKFIEDKLEKIKTSYVNESLKKKLKLNNTKYKNNFSLSKGGNYMFELVSSEDDYTLEENRNDLLHDCKYLSDYYREKGRRIHCEGKRKNSRCSKHWEKISEKKYVKAFAKREISSHRSVRSKKYLKKDLSLCESDSDRSASDGISRNKWQCYRKKKKKSEQNCRSPVLEKDSNNIIKIKNCSIKQRRDFDEVRKVLLEKLKEKEQARKNSGIVDKQIENTDALSPSESNGLNKYNENSSNKNSEEYLDRELAEGGYLDSENDEEMDVIQLRLIALASNKRQQNFNTAEEDLPKRQEDSKKFSSSLKSNKDNNYSCKDEDDADLDRNELLLRAEALKTALLKKHQKRLNKLKLQNAESSSDNDGTLMKHNFLKKENAEKGEECRNVTDAAKPNRKEFKSNNCNKNSQEIHIVKANMFASESLQNLSNIQNEENNLVDLSSASNESRKGSKNRIRKKRKRSDHFQDNRKENGVNQSSFEECQNLRSQLFCSATNKKSVLIDVNRQLNDNSFSTNNSSIVQKSKPVISSSSECKVEKNLQTTKSQKIAKNAEPEFQRIIVHLGSDDSSDDYLNEDDNDDDDDDDDDHNNNNKNVCENAKNAKDHNRNHGNLERPFTNQQNIPILPHNECSENSISAAKNEMENSIKMKYEKSVELLLRETQKKIEKELQMAKENESATNEAVYKHLPPSQRLEYIRLKQKIAERERLKKLSTSSMSKNAVTEEGKQVNLNSRHGLRALKGNSLTKVVPARPTTSSVASISSVSSIAKKMSGTLNKGLEASGSTGTSPSLLSLASKSVVNHMNEKAFANKEHTGSTSNAKEKIRQFSTSPINSKNIVSARATLRTSSVQALTSKLKLLLRKVKVEKTIEENYGKEIFKLRARLNLLEKMKTEQQLKIKKLAEESMRTYKAVQNITRAIEKVSPEDKKAALPTAKNKENFSIVENQADKSDWKMEEEIKSEKTENKRLNEMKLVRSHKDISSASAAFNEAERGSEKDGPCAGGEGNGSGEITQYNSPLEVFAQGSVNSERIDPNVIVCQFDLMGICKDEECIYQHFRLT